MPVTIASYNIHKGLGSDGRRLPARILDVLDELAADVAVLQESDTRFGRRTSVLPDAMLATRGWRAAPLAGCTGALGWHGNAILLRGALTLRAARRLVLPVLEPRGAVMADLALPGGRALRLVGAHLDLSGLWRTRQVQRIMERVARAPGSPPELVMGDLNEWRARADTLAAFTARLREVPLGPSFPARLPLGRLDRAFAHPALPIVAAGVHASALARVASDHLPVWVRLGDE
jgi:endonuclease/exonuclease/phosphatase family metal-dependent hydrolase